MKMKPILFSTPMIFALLEGRKTMTRRVIDHMGNGMHYGNLLCDWGLSEKPYIKDGLLYWELQTAVDDSRMFKIKPKYQSGDLLYVQETWKVDSAADHLLNMAIDFKALQSGHSQAEVLCNFTPDRYKKFRKYYQKNGWQSPYFMPCEAARLFLRVKNVRVERVQDITEGDALKEGVTGVPCSHAGCGVYGCEDCMNSGWIEPPQVEFMDLWDRLNKSRGYGWEVNPWVWVYEFERVDKPGEESE